MRIVLRGYVLWKLGDVGLVKWTQYWLYMFFIWAFKASFRPESLSAVKLNWLVSSTSVKGCSVDYGRGILEILISAVGW